MLFIYLLLKMFEIQEKKTHGIIYCGIENNTEAGAIFFKKILRFCEYYHWNLFDKPLFYPIVLETNLT